MFFSAENLLSDLHDVLQRASATAGDLLPFWTSIANAANTAAYWDIVGAFMERGYSRSVIDQWDRGEEFQRSIGLWWCLETGLSQDTQSYHPEALTEYKLDRRPELRNMPNKPGVILTVNGLFVKPDTTLGQASYGAYNLTPVGPKCLDEVYRS